MAFIISRLCRDCRDQACVAECPVDCIFEHAPEGGQSDLPNQVFVDPEACIDCGVCEPACPWEAIYPEHELPEPFVEDAALNAAIIERRAEFRVPEGQSPEEPTYEQVAQNKRAWGLATDSAA